MNSLVFNAVIFHDFLKIDRQCSCQLYTGRPGTDNHVVKIWFVIVSKLLVQVRLKPLGLLDRFNTIGKFGQSLNTEVIGDDTKGENERIKRKSPAVLGCNS